MLTSLEKCNKIRLQVYVSEKKIMRALIHYKHKLIIIDFILLKQPSDCRKNVMADKYEFRTHKRVFISIRRPALYFYILNSCLIKDELL
jgi:hypothetical protein